MPKTIIGNIYGTLQVLEEIGNNRVLVQCTFCEYPDNVNKRSIVSGTLHCGNCYTPLDGSRLDGSVYGSLEVLNHIKGAVECTCHNCGAVMGYTMQEINNNIECKKCKATGVLNKTEMRKHRC